MATAAGSALRPDRVPLSNGMVLLHNRAPSNPSVVVRALVRGGASREHATEHGVASLTGRMLRQGTHNISKADLAEELDGMGAGLSVDVGYALVAGSIKCLSGDFLRAMQLLSEVLMRPTFPADELERLRGQVLTDLKEMEDNTRVVADMTHRQLAFPSDHPYARLTVGTTDSVRRAGRDDLVRFHQGWYGPNQTTLIVVGDIELNQARDIAERVFADWPAVQPDAIEASIPDVEQPPTQRRDVPMQGKTQADVVIGLPTLQRSSPDYYALSFANHILGRMYFMGRFGEKVRDEQGLAYYAYSDLSAGFGPGLWTVRAGVNPTNLDKALGSIDTELRRFLDEGPTAEEQADGVSSVLGSLPRQLETNEGAAAVMSEIELYNLGLDYLERYPGIIRGLTREQVTDTARRWIQGDHLVTAVAGPPRG